MHTAPATTSIVINLASTDDLVRYIDNLSPADEAQITADADAFLARYDGRSDADLAAALHTTPDAAAWVRELVASEPVR